MINVSIVLYKHSWRDIEDVVRKCIKVDEIKAIYLIDNSPTQLEKRNLLPKVHYLYVGANIGYGSGHNIALRHSIEENIAYHLVLNPDVNFDSSIIKRIFEFMNSSPETGSLMPKVYFKSGELQRLCKLLPTPFDLFCRRFTNGSSWTRKYIERYELGTFSHDRIANIPNLSGCFMFLRIDILKQVGIFDQRYFMYLEDVDLVRRIHRVSKTIFYPDVSITHGYAKGSYNNRKLLTYHLISALKYFNKWGWIFDSERRTINVKALNNIGILQKKR